jgi:hypothetical protein
MVSYDGHMAVQRARWTDERLDALAERVNRQDVIDVRLDALERSFADLRSEMREFRSEVKADLKDLRTEVVGVRGELYATKRWMMTMWLSGVLAFAAIFVEISLRT